ncbi:MAG: molybdopterin/thiamine biosynthesis adenylyltransferase/rhodanese-related sulfurtransferase [Bradymonadia bacterium]
MGWSAAAEEESNESQFSHACTVSQPPSRLKSSVLSVLDRRLAALRTQIGEVDPTAIGDRVLVDVREAEEHAEGRPADAHAIPRGRLEMRIAEIAAVDTPVALICAAGTRSLLAAGDLAALGYTDVVSVKGGFSAWRQAGLPEARATLDAQARARYARHLSIPEVGEAGQAKLLASRVLCIGAGGIGSPALLYLAAAGVGTLGIVDDDIVERSNLQRQVIHGDAKVGMAKVRSAEAAILGLNPNVRVDAQQIRLTASNAEALIGGWDVVIDGADNFPTRYAINDACVATGVPNVHGAVHRFGGQVSVFSREGPCYRCLFARPPPPELIPNCAEAGVLGVVPGVIGILQAVEAIKLLLGIGEPLRGRLLQYNALSARTHTVALAAHCDRCVAHAHRQDSA